ncbi:acetoin utilization deacetylase AcuC-like enzyme [Desulfobotulus alkaliphilus]|uniref:Acetoin utilization deacetylase AcuC-like enzyme n=2 Tax=Desulfobotulus alkaliphilus TaxID=622671 RepID=A0A562RQS0_9BACT|nr:acetoin utilization deacetylase AcuC-like enzyme [Desulfobotulus alkaliphilus]
MMLKAKSKTGLVFFPAFDWAIDPSHPEREERLLYTQDQIFEEGLMDIEGIQEFKPDLVTDQDIQRVHFCVPDEPTVTTSSHYVSAGGAKTMARELMEGRIEKGFALVRPPGHHAMRVVHGGRGFCNINIEAIMVEYLRTHWGVKRIAIVDTDCHHGDGTQDIYWHDPDVLFISLHQDGRTLYPGSGFMEELGGPNAAGYTVNIPLPPHTSEEGYLYTVENAVLPILDDFKPDLIINSAGQDNHYTDPITNMNFTAQGYARLTELLNPHIAVLEGGYSIEAALPYVNAGIILAMAGLDYSHVLEPDYNPAVLKESKDTLQYIHKVCDRVMDQWNRRGPELSQKVFGKKEFHERSRSIMYDTDGIYEGQKEILRSCTDCAGSFRIESKSDRGWRIIGVHIPVNACPACKAQGEDWYEKASGADKAYLQDRSRDLYLKKS